MFMFKLTKRTKILLITGVVLSIVAACLIVYFISRKEGTQQPGAVGETLSESEMENLAIQRSGFSSVVGVIEVSDPSVNDFIREHKIFQIVGRGAVFGPPLVSVVAVGRHDGRTFVLPDEFNDMIQRENLKVNENTALDLSKVYVISWVSSSTYEEISFLQGATDIPWSENAEGADPSKYENVIEPPQVTQMEENYQATFYTWTKTYGFVYKWIFNVNSDGQLLSHTEETAMKVGDFASPPHYILSQ